MRLRRIARAGKHWKNTIGRQVDMEGEPITTHHDCDANQSYPRYRATQRMSFDYAWNMLGWQRTTEMLWILNIDCKAKISFCVGQLSYRILSYCRVLRRRTFSSYLHAQLSCPQMHLSLNSPREIPNRI